MIVDAVGPVVERYDGEVQNFDVWIRTEFDPRHFAQACRHGRPLDALIVEGGGVGAGWHMQGENWGRMPGLHADHSSCGCLI